MPPTPSFPPSLPTTTILFIVESSFSSKVRHRRSLSAESPLFECGVDVGDGDAAWMTLAIVLFAFGILKME